MPKMNGTGPWGYGPMTGRGLGPCAGGRQIGRGGAFGRGFGFGRRWTQKDEMVALDEEEQILKDELAQVQADKKALKEQK